MRGSRRAVLLCSMLLSASLGRAQERGHAAFVLGWTFGEETSSLYGAQFGARLGGGFSLVGGVESLKDTLTGRYAFFLNQLSTVPGVNVTAKVPGVYYGGGLRWMFQGAGVSPFAQVEFGGTKITPEVAFTVDGRDITDQVLAPGELDETAFTFSLGGGLRGNLNDYLFVEVVFKFFDILTEQELNLNRLSFAVGARF